MALEVVKAVVGLLFLLGDISFMVTCSVLHFMRGDVEDGTVQGAFTLVLFFTAGLVTNLFHCFRTEHNRRSFQPRYSHLWNQLVRHTDPHHSGSLQHLKREMNSWLRDYIQHEWKRMEQPSLWAKFINFLLIFVPCSSVLRWYIGICRDPRSDMCRCWTSTLRLLYYTGTLTQAVLQGYVVMHLWWAQHVANRDGEGTMLSFGELYPANTLTVTTMAAVFFSLRAIYGLCDYIWTGYYDETHTNLQALDYTLILLALNLNMGTVADLAKGSMDNHPRQHCRGGGIDQGGIAKGAAFCTEKKFK